MDLNKLKELYDSSRHDPNYQFRNISNDEFDQMAIKSFQRVPEAQQKKVQSSWLGWSSKYGLEPSPEVGLDLLRYRFLCQTNLYFLCKVLEKYNQTTLKTHEDICNDFFVQKNPTFATFEKFANQYTDLKDSLLLVPRGGFKSSINMADCVQWIVCFPAVTILVLTGTLRLAGDFVGEIKQHFTLDESDETDLKTGKAGFKPRQMMDSDTGFWTDSAFQILFPEHCVPPNDGTQSEFQTPAGGDDKEPTVRAASIEQALSGMHFGILKMDDVVTNENSKTLTRIKDVNKQISVNKAMMHPYGFFTVVGTWYDELDFYGATIKREEKFAAQDGLLDNIKGSVDSGRFNSTVQFKVYLRACWWPTDLAVKAGKIEEEYKKDDYILWFPERLSYEFLTKEQKNDSDQDADGDTGYFAIKYLNNPRKLHKVKFPKELLLRRTIPATQLPPQGVIVTTVDTAYSIKSWADYTVIMTALIYGGRFYIINMKRGRFNEYELPAMIAATAYQWKPKRIAIEDSTGVKWMSRELKREMDKLQISVPVEYVPLGQGSKANSKKMKAKPVVRLLGDERMYFLNSCEGLEEIYSELTKFTGTSEDAHDDVVSGLSLLAEVFGPYAEMGAKTDPITLPYAADQKSKDMHDRIYGMGRYAQYNASNSDSPSTMYQIENSKQFQDAPDIDPFAELMS